MGCTASHPATLDEPTRSPRRSSLASRLSTKTAQRSPAHGEQQHIPRAGRGAKPAAFKSALPATPENLPENHGSLDSLPVLQFSMDSISSSESNMGTSVALGHTGLTRSTGGSDALSHSTASTIGAKSQASDANKTLLLSGPHRLSQASTIDGARLSFDTRKMEEDIRSSLDSEGTTSPIASPSAPGICRTSGSPLWRNAVLSNNNAIPVPRSTPQPAEVAAGASTAAYSPTSRKSDSSSEGKGTETVQKRAPSEVTGRSNEGQTKDGNSVQRPALRVDVRTQSCNLDTESAPATGRGPSKNGLYFINSNHYHRPTYERDAVDDEFAAANGLSLPRFIPRHALQNGRSPDEDSDKSTHHGSFQAYSNEGPVRPSGSIIMDAHMNDLACLSPIASPMPEQHMGSLTGWQAIAAQIMEEADDDTDKLVADLSYGTGGTDASETPHTRGPRAKFGSMFMDSPSTPRTGPDSPGTPRAWHHQAEGSLHPKTPRVKARYGSIVDVARRHQQNRAPSIPAAPPVQVAFQPGGGFYVQYECQEKLGAGAFGEAVKARRRKDGQMFVVKMMHSKSMTDKAKEEARNEVHVLATLNHPNIVKYYESFLDNHDGRLLIVMELCEEGDLDLMIKKRNGAHMSEDEIMMKFVQICLGLLHVHSKGIIHRDLKTNNIFCCANGIVKLGDFGISKMLTGGEKIARTMVGTPYYMSPEIIKGRKYDAKTDVWAVGCVLYELCALRKAFDATNLAAITVKVMSGKIPPVPDQYGSEIKELIHKLIQKKPDARPELQDVLKLAFVRKHLVAYEKHVLTHVNVKQRESFVASVVQYIPELARVQDTAGMLSQALTNEPRAVEGLDTTKPESSDASNLGNSGGAVEERGNSIGAISSRSSSATEKGLVRKEEMDAMVRDLRAREEAASREKLRAFKASRPRAKSRTMELLGMMHGSSSAPDLLMMAMASQGSEGLPPLPPSDRAARPPVAPPVPAFEPCTPIADSAAAAGSINIDAAPLQMMQDSPPAAIPRISIRSAGAVLGDIKAILQQPVVDRLEPLTEEQSVTEELSADRAR